ncbi:hypothetical protein DMZ43_12340 [Meridianimaribacter sp. CL38]|nr:hypothetical protein DMZ43_12340 [Meridianimaribacter sp. CL38]
MKKKAFKLMLRLLVYFSISIVIGFFMVKLPYQKNIYLFWSVMFLMGLTAAIIRFFPDKTESKIVSFSWHICITCIFSFCMFFIIDTYYKTENSKYLIPPENKKKRL